MSEVVECGFAALSTNDSLSSSTPAVALDPGNLILEGLGIFGGIDDIGDNGQHAGIASFSSNTALEEDVLGNDLEDSDLNHKVKNNMFSRIDYTKRNHIPERQARVLEAKDLAKDLYGVNLREWQARILWDLPKGRHVMCIVATGQGKTMVTSIFNGLFMVAYVLYISPLIALMESQVV